MHCIILIVAYNNRTKKKAAVENQPSTNPPRRGPDVELATLRQLPIRHSTNILYNQVTISPSLSYVLKYLNLYG